MKNCKSKQRSNVLKSDGLWTAYSHIAEWTTVTSKMDMILVLAISSKAVGAVMRSGREEAGGDGRGGEGAVTLIEIIKCKKQKGFINYFRDILFVVVKVRPFR